MHSASFHFHHLHLSQFSYNSFAFCLLINYPDFFCVRFHISTSASIFSKNASSHLLKPGIRSESVLLSVVKTHSCNRRHCCRLAHDITLENVSATDDADTPALGYDCKRQQNGVHHHHHQLQQQRQTTSTTLLDRLQSRIESRNQRNAAKSKLITASDSHGEKADSETTQTETPPDMKQKADSRLAAICRSPRIEDVADAGLNALSGNRRRQTTDATVICRNVELNSVTSRLDEIRQRFKSEVFM